MKKICLVGLIAFAACNSTPKVEPVKEIPLEEQQAKLEDTLMKMTAKMMEDSTVLKDTAFKKTYPALRLVPQGQVAALRDVSLRHPEVQINWHF